jgi:hypothetical protein
MRGRQLDTNVKEGDYQLYMILYSQNPSYAIYTSISVGILLFHFVYLEASAKRIIE